MNIREFAVELQNIYDEMGNHFAGFQKASGLHCLEGCGKCCTNPEVEASAYEMIPLALKILDENKLEEWLTKLENPTQEHCLLFESHSSDGRSGLCTSYQQRPAVCRMFGVAGYYDKHHQVTLSVCKLIREKYPELTEQRIKEANTEHTPMLTNWNYRMAELNPNFVQEKLPLNQALKQALEKVALYAQYQDET